MTLRIVNKFHNKEIYIELRGEMTWRKYKKYEKRCCSQKDCRCETLMYLRSGNVSKLEVGFDSRYPAMYFWEYVDPVTLQLQDAGYGVKS